MEQIVRSDWATRMQMAAACGAISLLAAIVLGVF
jgi:hypothetical protein